MTIHQVLKHYWGYDAFRALQEEIVQSVLEGKDTLALLPTGGGKSICFQVPALVQPGICVVVSPLIALMKDQVENLKVRGIEAVAIVSGMSKREVDILLDNCVYGKIKFLYISPERLSSPLVQERIRHMNVNLFAIDEAHCISQWGYDFRPPYLQLAELRQLHPKVPILALTATATQQVADDIVDVKADDWILCEHGRWTMTIEIKQDDGTKFKFQKIDPNGILAVAPEKPDDMMFGESFDASAPAHRPEDFGAR